MVFLSDLPAPFQLLVAVKLEVIAPWAVTGASGKR